MIDNAALAGQIAKIHASDDDPTRPPPLDWIKYSDSTLSQWFALLESDPEEKKVQEFLELHPSMIPGGSGDIGPGGHHQSEMGLVFREARLRGAGRDYGPDFMWVTRSSGLITPILIEIEKPSKRWFKSDGRPTRHLADAHDQLNDWSDWFAREGNEAIFRETYLFKEPYQSRRLEPQYLLIYGRSNEFELGGGHTNPDAIRHKRDGLRRKNEYFMTFDSLRPNYNHRLSITATRTVNSVEPFAFSPVYGTSAAVSRDASLVMGDPAAAFARSQMMSAERKLYLSQRWQHWKDVALTEKTQGRMQGHDLGLE